MCVCIVFLSIDIILYITSLSNLALFHKHFPCHPIIFITKISSDGIIFLQRVHLSSTSNPF